MFTTHSFSDFDSAAQAALTYLHQRMGLSLWMITRTELDDWIVLQAEDHGYGVQKGDVFHWPDSFCSRMVRGEGPHIAPQSDLVEVYRNAPIAQQVPIGAYVGVPITYGNGALFGTLCAIDPQPQPDNLADELPLVELIAKLLSTILDFFLKAEMASRREEQQQFLTERDEVTGFYSHLGWEKLLASEEARCQKFGFPVSVIIVDLEEGQRPPAEVDRLMGQAAKIIRTICRQEDLCARIGARQFAILCIECHISQADFIRERLALGFQQGNITVDLGIAERSPQQGLHAAVDMAKSAAHEQGRFRTKVKV
ncbi:MULTISPECIES: diguanylate cyclase domain-containing protein [Synechocystis]|uniref:Diguanylate cyclase n=3 Tax=Synechocystis TaxID=1142 RepID=A0ABR9VVK7_9SYNC|nr:MULTISPECIES: diguanylate cyclase [Synechocystis]MBD2655107.1 diguanylate cyclase [Synechocystis sp. FACHB-383]MBE9242186.1 diguanylate cyclase [Synechocystis salina LEGE 00041]MBE9255376.1 diguanylate cyclase [Synechocystis salina LEGE 00031]